MCRCDVAHVTVCVGTVKATPSCAALIMWIARDVAHTHANADVVILRSDVDSALCTLDTVKEENSQTSNRREVAHDVFGDRTLRC